MRKEVKDTPEEKVEEKIEIKTKQDVKRFGDF